VAEASAKLADAKRGREHEDGELAKKLQRLKDLAEERKKAEAELATLKENDPQALADLEKELQLVKAAANRWTDNIFTCKAYLVKKKNMGKRRPMPCLESLPLLIVSAWKRLFLVYYIMEYALTCHSPVHILLQTPKTRFSRNRFILLFRYTYFQFAVSWRNANMKCDFQTCS
jgi:plasmid stabilization system protein ParE